MSADYLSTNESLEAIMQCMELTRKDNVLAICGSGDQVFAMSEYAGDIIAMDLSLEQIEYAESQRNTILRGNLMEFIYTHTDWAYMKNSKVRQKYFSKAGRMEKIRENLGRISFASGDIKAYSPGAKFSRFYLSNVHLGDDVEDVEVICRVMRGLSAGGICYHASGAELKYMISTSPEIARLVFIDEELTRKAQALENSWEPLVLRRRA